MQPAVRCHFEDRILTHLLPGFMANRFRSDDNGTISLPGIVIHMREAADLTDPNHIARFHHEHGEGFEVLRRILAWAVAVCSAT